MFEACSCIRWGFIFKSIIFSILECLSASASEFGTGEALWFCWLSPTVSLGGIVCPLLVSPRSTGSEAGSSRWPGLSPGNYRRIKECKFLWGISQNRRAWLHFLCGDKPQLSVSIEDIFHASFYLQHEQSCHIANTGSSHLPHSKRKLQTDFQEEKHKLEVLLPNTRGLFLKNKWKSKKWKRDVHTRCIFTYVTAGNITGTCKTNPYMPASKLIAHVNLPFPSTAKPLP